MLYQITHCAGHVLAITRPHQLRWGDREMETGISCSQMTNLALRASVFSFELKIVRSDCNRCIKVDLLRGWTIWLSNSCCCGFHLIYSHVLRSYNCIAVDRKALCVCSFYKKNRNLYKCYKSYENLYHIT